MITGGFTALNVPEVEVEADVKATISYSIRNEGALTWRSFVIAISGGEEIKNMIDATNETGEMGERTYTDRPIGRMPLYPISITFSLWWHDDWWTNWDWNDIYRWRDGLPTVATFIEARYITIAPIPLGEPEFKDLISTYRRA